MDSTRPKTSFSSSSSTSWSFQSGSSADAPLRVGVIGGGIAGLTLGQLLHDTPHIRVTVYEKSIEPLDRLSGYRVMLSHFVLRNLQAMLRTEVWTRVAASIGVQPVGGQELKFLKSDGTPMFTYDTEEMRDTYSISRWSLRRALLHKSSSFMRFGKSFLKYEKQRNGTVKIFFDDGTTDECDLIIGADGAGSRVRKQLVPEAKVTETELMVIYFKIPLTLTTRELLLSDSATLSLSHKNQNIMLHTWISPLKPWSTKFSSTDISNEESFIMYGYGSPRHEFTNRTKPASKMSGQELKDECLARVHADPGIDPRLVRLTELCLPDTAYVHSMRDCQVVKRWDTGCVTLVGDAVFNISTMLGKGANCALLDAYDLAATLRRPSITITLKRRWELRKRAEENVKRRLVERKRAALIQGLVYLGDSKLKEFCRGQGLKMAFEWIGESACGTAVAR